MAIKRIVALVNNGHTSLMPGSYSAMCGRAVGAYADGVKESRTGYWTDLAGAVEDPALLMPFLAVYSAGDYVSVDAETALRESGVVPGVAVVRVDAWTSTSTWQSSVVRLGSSMTPSAAAYIFRDYRRPKRGLREGRVQARRKMQLS